jgi:hypothetical protein
MALVDEILYGKEYIRAAKGGISDVHVEVVSPISQPDATGQASDVAAVLANNINGAMPTEDLNNA